MRISLLTKFVLSSLVAGIVLVGIMIGWIQFYAFQNFSDYVTQMEYAQLDDLNRILGEKYQANGNWDFLQDNHRGWQEILRQAGLITRPGTPGPSNPGFGKLDFGNPRLRPPQRRPGPLPGRSEKDPRDQDPFPPVQNPRGQATLGSRVTLLDQHQKVVMGRKVSTDFSLMHPIIDQGGPVGFLTFEKTGHLSHPLDVKFIKQQKKSFYLAGVVFLLCSGLISFLLARHLLAPIRELSRGTRALGKRRFDTRIIPGTRDELGRLADDFNRMAITLGDYELRQTQWLSDISHELRTPLSILQGELEAVQFGIRKLDKGTVESLSEEVNHLIRLVNDLHELSMAEAEMMTLTKVPLDAGKILEDTLDRFEDQFKKNRIRIETHFCPQPKAQVSADPDRLVQLFSNLLKNSLRYTDSPGRLDLGYHYSKEEIIIHIEDSAPGVPVLLRSRLFERLFRLEGSRNREKGGSGLGLSICKYIIHAHSGSIQVFDGSLGGLKVEIRLPKIKVS